MSDRFADRMRAAAMDGIDRFLTTRLFDVRLPPHAQP
jgi:hypothetical protein